MTDLRAQGGQARPGATRQHLVWLAAGLGVGFAVPFLFADVLRLPRDVYDGIHIAAVLLFFVLWPVRPVAAHLVGSVPTLVTLNAIGTPITRAGIHVTAVLHSYNTDVFLPPHR
jgi:hypothetical protein